MPDIPDNAVVFTIGELRPLWEHATTSIEHREFYGKKIGAALLLVHDQGIYMMSNGTPHLPNPDNPEHSKVVYAAGFSPDDDDFWERARDAVGGDDFGYPFDDDFCDVWFQLDDDNVLTFTVRDDAIDIKAEGPP